MSKSDIIDKRDVISRQGTHLSIVARRSCHAATYVFLTSSILVGTILPALSKVHYEEA